MAKRVQRLRHTATPANAFTGLQGEITVVIGTYELRVHDGTTAGGYAQILTATQIAAAYQTIDATLTALAALNSTGGLVVQTGADTFTKRALTGTANQVTVADGDGVSGAPTVSLPNDVQVDVISERTASAGVTVDGVLLKDSNVSADTVTADVSVVTGTIAEKTAAAGVTVDSVLLKDGQVVVTGDPSSALQVATKQYVDAAINGYSWKASVRVATTTGGEFATAFDSGSTVDGIVIATGDRILIKNQSSAAENGIYVVAASGAPTRATDFDAWTEVPGAAVFVQVGTVNADKAFLCTSNAGGTIGSTAIVFSAYPTATPTASESASGTVELATQSETNTGTDAVRAVTPLKLLTWVTGKLIATVWNWVKAQRLTQNVVAFNSGNPTVDFSLGNDHILTATANVATVSASNIPSAGITQHGMITLVCSGGAWTVSGWSSDFLNDGALGLSTVDTGRYHIPYFIENAKVILGTAIQNPA